MEKGSEQFKEINSDKIKDDIEERLKNQYKEMTPEGCVLTDSARKAKYENASKNPPEGYKGYNWLDSCAHCGSETINADNGNYSCSAQSPCGWGPGWIPTEDSLLKREVEKVLKENI